MKPRIEKTIIVEGKYDKIRLSNIVDANILVTDGFALFKDREKAELIRRLAVKDGIAILTDSDSAGFVIRNHIKGIVDDGQIVNVYIPETAGKERRKERAGKEGLLGVEGIEDSVILDALNKAGLICGEMKSRDQITKTDLFNAGLSGAGNSAMRRKEIMKKLSLPSKLSSTALLEVLNALYTREEFLKSLEE